MIDYLVYLLFLFKENIVGMFIMYRTLGSICYSFLVITCCFLINKIYCMLLRKKFRLCYSYGHIKGNKIQVVKSTTTNNLRCYYFAKKVPCATRQNKKGGFSSNQMRPVQPCTLLSINIPIEKEYLKIFIL